MRRCLAFALTGALLWAGAPSAEAQTGQRPLPSRFDLGLHVGGSWSSDWFRSRLVTTSGGVITETGGSEGYRIGANPVFGATATLWMSPMFGVRLHGSYIPSSLPSNDGEDTPGFFTGSPRALNNYLYDLNLVLRPWFGRVGQSALMSSAYLFAGGGGFTSNLAGEGLGCEPTLLALGACLSYDPERASVGQGTVGLGVDLVSLTNSLGLFAEIAAHGYSPPTHVGDGWVPRVMVPTGGTARIADNRFAVTGRLVGGVKLAVGSIGAIPVVVPPAPPPPPPPAPPPAPATREIAVCVIEGGALRTVTTTFNPATGDTMVAGQPFATRYPASAPTYAAGAPWFAASDDLRFQARDYVRFGVTRVVQPPQLQAVGQFEGTTVFAEAGAATPFSVVYLPVRPGCEFQPYQLREAIRPRG